MRAEDLFEAMEGISEELIAQSEGRPQSAEKSGTKRKGGKRRRKLYRFAAVAATTAAAVFMLLLARDFIGTSDRTQLVESPAHSEALEAESGGADAGDAAAEEAGDRTALQEASGGAIEENREQALAEGGADQTEAQADQPADRLNRKNGQAEQSAVQAGQAAEAAENVEDTEEAAGKTAVDLLGDLKGDYVRLEYISAEEEAAGGSRKVPEYSEEGEKALSRAFDNGKPKIAAMARTGSPIYYVYLTKANGDEDTVTFYENEYMSMNTYPGMVMAISEEDYEEILKLFH